MRNIAVIPARSGSKGLKNKNIIKLDGKPLMAYSIEAAQQSGLYDVVHVSTDSEEYARIAMEYGADVPFLRNSQTSSDTASTWDTVRYVLKKYEARNEKFDVATVLQPTSPFRTSEDIINAYAFFLDKNANMVSSVCETEHSPLWSYTLPEDLSMSNFGNEAYTFLPRQSLQPYYRENGAIYIIKVNQLFLDINIYKDRCYAFIMNKNHSVDIDSQYDFLISQAILKISQEQRSKKNL